ncbi:MAG TPA: DUF4270 family protein [Cyclobacteriaceae bacterium]|nr:DUF4270 family protein [Cyclobacteriaceae bacterium]
MNLWARRIGLTAMSALLFFFGCEDPLSNLGFRNPNQKFNVRYAEIEIPTSLILVDSVPTVHDLNYPQDDIYRLMVGLFNNNTFGNTSATAITQYRPANFGRTIAEDAIFDSLVLKLKLDFYTTGTTANAPIRVNIFEIGEELIPGNDYHNNSQIAIEANLLGQAELLIQPNAYNAFLDAGVDTVIHLKAHLNHDLGLRLFEAASVADSTYNQYQFFRKRFKGLALVPENAQHVIGLSIANPTSRIELHYHDAADTLQIDFYFDSVIGFSTIDVDRGGTALSGLVNTFTDFIPADNNMYVQGGTGLVTKLDFSKFMEFTDTIPDILLNSAELVIENTQTATGIRFPDEFKLKVLRDNNRFRQIDNKQDSAALRLYRLSFTSANQYDRVWYDLDFSFLVAGDQFSSAIMTRRNDGSYQTFITLFLQRLLEIKEPEKQFTRVGVYASKPVFGKSLNGVYFPKDNVKLRLYYTKPVIQ